MNKKSDKSFAKTFLAMLAVFLLPFVMVAAVLFAAPAVYDDTFVGELQDKFDRLKSLDGQKIVVVGGSSVAFGLDSEMMEKELGCKAVNFGLYADLGTKLMMELSRTAVNEGDVFILAPEISSQTLSLYLNAETALQAMDGRYSMLIKTDVKDTSSYIGASWKTAGAKLNYLINGSRPQNSGAYKKENFNQYGDNIYDRPYNELNGFGSPINLNFQADFTDNVSSDYEEFIEYINDYTDYVRSKGAEVYFSFPPMNELAINAANGESDITEFYKNLCLSLKCKVISNIYDYILDDGYFFDSEFHLNNSGVTVRTVKLIDDIKREWGIDSLTLAADLLPPPPGHRPDDNSPENTAENQENLYFVLEKAQDGGWAITDLNEAGMKAEQLTVPDYVEDAAVTTICSAAFSGSKAKSLTIGANISRIDGGALRDSVITEIYIPAGRKAADISVPNNTSEELFTAGGQQRLAIYVDSESYEEFIGDYFWGDYGPWLRVKE